MTGDHATRHRKGLLLAFLGVLILTPDTLILRLIETGTWELVFWRGFLMFVAIIGVLVIVGRGRLAPAFRAMGVAGLWFALLYGVNQVTFVLAVMNTSVANTLILLATMPIFSALYGRFLLGERIATRTVCTIAIVIIGIMLVVAEGASSTDTQRPLAQRLFGEAMALTTAMLLAGALTIARQRCGVSMIPAAALGGIMSCAPALVLAGPTVALTAPLVGGQTLILIALMGLVIVPIPFALITTAPRYIPAAEVSLIMLLEAVFGPLWVWVALGEAIGPLAFVGGAVILGALAANSWLGIKAAHAEA